jgi:LacI family transcriptional regulator
MHVTLADVAQLASVSPKTVSRVVNNQGEIRDETRQRVQAAIEQLGYRPNILARSLVSQRSNSLGVVTSGLEYYGPSQTLSGIEQRSYDLGYSLIFSLLPRPDVTNINPILDQFIARRVDGIIWAVPEINHNRQWIRPEMLEHLPPIVFLAMQPQPDLAVVSIDNRSGGAQATQHLIDIGRRKIGTITGPMDWWEACERYNGYVQTMQANGLEFSPDLVSEGDWSAQSGQRGFRELLERRPDLDAVFVGNDQMALGALGEAYRRGLRIPDDVAVVGFDNCPDSACYWPPLSTIQHQLFEAGCLSVQKLLQQVDTRSEDLKNTEPQSSILPTQLIIRASSAGS